MYQYPYGNAQQLNLDWLMEQWQEVKQSIDGSLQGEIDRVEAAITDLLAARDAAAASAAAAGNSATAAAQSAQAAAGNAATAAAQAALATQERVNAAQAANNAQTQAAAAANSAGAAANSAGSAATSASQAAASASDAHDEAVDASGSAINAAASAAAAQQSFTLADAARQAAQGSASNAAASAQEAQDILDSIPEDYTELSEHVETNTEDIVELKNYVDETLEPITIDNAQYISIDDGVADIPVSGRLIFDTQQQGTGTPSASNVRNIQPMETTITCYLSGKNLYRFTPILRSDNNRYVTLRGGYTANSVVSAIAIKPNERIYVKISVSSSVGSSWGVYGSWTDGRSEQVLSSLGTSLTRTFTLFNSRDYSRGFGIWLFASSGGTFANKTISVMMTVNNYSDFEEQELGSTSVPLPAELQNVICGGEYDLTTGELTVTRKLINSYDGETLPAYWISSKDVYAEGTTPTLGAKVAYDLAEPETYQLDPLNLILLNGYNYSYNYYGHFEPFIYRKANNTTELIKLTKNIIAPVLDAMVADTALVANDFRIVGNTLYRITAPVAAGAALTPNTNCTATTIGAVLKTLLT